MHPRLLRVPRGTLISSLKPKTNELKNILHQQILQQGPLPIANYIKQCLTHPDYGYYMNRDVFGKGGDFITSPDISQIFGELIGVWCAQCYDILQRPKTWNIIELGPGRGTLSSDVLRTLKQLSGFDAVKLHLVDVSPELRRLQAQKIKKTCKQIGVNLLEDEASNGMLRLFKYDLEINWYESLDQLMEYYKNHQSKNPKIILAHEFFDALPPYVFEYSEQKGWLERLVGVDTEGKFKYELSQNPTENVVNILQPAKRFSPDKVAELRNGDTIELSKDQMQIMSSLCDLVNMGGGMGLIIDYGEDHALSNSIRGIKEHKLYHDEWLNMPGEADISAYVNFQSLKGIGRSVENIRTLGPIPQQMFLQNMGIETRFNVLTRKASVQTYKKLQSEVQRLVDGDQMGEIYKFLYFGHEKYGNVYPFFDVDV